MQKKTHMSKIMTSLIEPKTNKKNNNRSSNRENGWVVAVPLAWVRLEKDENDTTTATNDVAVNNPTDRT